jgi:hypothetical protein
MINLKIRMIKRREKQKRKENDRRRIETDCVVLAMMVNGVENFAS